MKLWSLLCLMLCVGCVTKTYDNAARLIARDDFPAAVSGSAAWVEEALKTINSLEQELEDK